MHLLPGSGQYRVHPSPSILMSELLHFTSGENPSKQSSPLDLSHNYTTAIPKQMTAFSLVALMIYYVFFWSRLAMRSTRAAFFGRTLHSQVLRHSIDEPEDSLYSPVFFKFILLELTATKRTQKQVSTVLLYQNIFFPLQFLSFFFFPLVCYRAFNPGDQYPAHPLHYPAASISFCTLRRSDLYQVIPPHTLSGV